MASKHIKTFKNIVKDRDKLMSLIHFITNKCNARCPHCFIDFNNKDTQAQKMSLSDIEAMTKKVGPELINVNITGGEPFYSNDLEAICELYIKNTNISSIFFSTHGGATKRIESFLKFAEKFPSITFIFSLSVDHLGDSHSEYRKVNRLFESAMETYDLLKNAGSNIKAMVSITVSEFNAKEIGVIFDTLTQDYGVREITANIVRDEGVYQTPKGKKQEILEGYKVLTKKITDHKKSKNQNNYNIKTNLYNKMMNYKDEVMHQEIISTYMEPKYKVPCYAGGGLLGVLYPNGDIYPCEILEDKKMGNLYDYNMDIQKLWEDNFELRQWIKNSKCNCTYECAWSYNIIANKKYYPGILLANLKP